jgi:hypothetical protein
MDVDGAHDHDEPAPYRVPIRKIAAVAALAMWPFVSRDALSQEVRPRVAPTPEIELPVVEVEASRLRLEQRVNQFVRSITRHIDDESPAVWHTRVCPLVAGLKPPQGEAVLARISEIALASGIPLGREQCRPNLYVVATDDPTGLVSGWRKRSPAMFEGATPLAAERFQSTPRPVRAWYQVARIGADGVRLQSLDGVAGRASNVPLGRLPNTRLERGTVLSLSSVFIVVDARATQNIRLQQLADYVAMVGLMELHQDADYSGFPTILGLFEDGKRSDTVTGGMTAWDGRFLHALYDTEQKYVMQRSQVVQRMVRDLHRRTAHPSAQ